MNDDIISKSFNELSDTNKQLAIKATINDSDYLDSWWHESTNEDFGSILEILGYFDVKSYFTGFHSQGDGASFEASYTYNRGSHKVLIAYAPEDTELHRIGVALKDIQTKCRYDLGATISKGGHYCHENTMSCTVHSYHGRVLDETVEQYEDEFLELSRDLARWYYKQLNNTYDYLMSDEAVIEHIIGNELEFNYEDN